MLFPVRNEFPMTMGALKLRKLASHASTRMHAHTHANTQKRSRTKPPGGAEPPACLMDVNGVDGFVCVVTSLPPVSYSSINVKEFQLVALSEETIS